LRLAVWGRRNSHTGYSCRNSEGPWPRLLCLRSFEEGEQIGYEILRRLPSGIMADAGADPEDRPGNARGEMLLLGLSEDTVPVPAEDQHRAADPSKVRTDQRTAAVAA
jgi:hypothetical protein